MIKIDSDPIFILGVERCGSTWLSNIFDSSPDAIFYMEPFANFAKIFEGFPERMEFAAQPYSQYNNILKKGFESLYSHKYPFIETHSSGKFSRNISKSIFSKQDHLAKYRNRKRNLKSIRYRLLNLNRMEVDNFPAKNKSINKIIVKELRLNYKINVLKEYFPNAKYIVVIRNPVAQLHSISKLFEKGTLHQLKGSLDLVFKAIEGSAQLERYRAASSSLNQISTLDRLVAYWFTNYNTLIKDLSTYNCNYRIVTHEELSNDTEMIVKELLDFMRMQYPDSVKSYISKSTSGHNTVDSPLDTHRSSKTYYEEVLKSIDSSFKEDFKSRAKYFWELSVPEVRKYEESI